MSRSTQAAGATKQGPEEEPEEKPKEDEEGYSEETMAEARKFGTLLRFMGVDSQPWCEAVRALEKGHRVCVGNSVYGEGASWGLAGDKAEQEQSQSSMAS